MHLLSMAFPNLEGPLFGLGQMVEEVVILPDYTVKELFGAIQKSLSEMESKSFETDASPKTNNIGSTQDYSDMVRELKAETDIETIVKGRVQ